MSKQNLLAMGWAASQFGFLVVAGLVIGVFVDRYFGTTPIFALLGLILGLFTGIRVLLAVFKTSRKQD